MPATPGPRGDRTGKGLLLALVRQDIAGYLRGPLPTHLILFLPAAVFLAAWFAHTASPVVPIMIVLFAGLEPRFNNILFNTPNEFYSFSVMPVPWSTFVLTRNCSTILLAVTILVPLTLIVLFISPWMATWNDAADGVLYFGSVLPSLLHFGNSQSVRSPRPVVGLRMNDIAEMVWMMGSVALASVPYLVLCEMLDLRFLCWIYASIWFVYWWKASATRTGERIQERMDILVELT